MNPKSPSPDETLRASGLRPTRARRLLLDHLASRLDHPSTDGILDSLRATGHRVGTATVYQNLSKLVSTGLVARFVGPDGVMHFDGNVSPHPHAVCRACGAIVDAAVTDESLRALEPYSPHDHRRLDDWKIESIQLEFGGLCPTCRSNDDE